MPTHRSLEQTFRGNPRPSTGDKRPGTVLYNVKLHNNTVMTRLDPFPVLLPHENEFPFKRQGGAWLNSDNSLPSQAITREYHVESCSFLESKQKYPSLCEIFVVYTNIKYIHPVSYQSVAISNKSFLKRCFRDPSYILPSSAWLGRLIDWPCVQRFWAAWFVPETTT